MRSRGTRSPREPTASDDSGGWGGMGGDPVPLFTGRAPPLSKNEHATRRDAAAQELAQQPPALTTFRPPTAVPTVARASIPQAPLETAGSSRS